MERTNHLSADERQAFHLQGVAYAWLEKPIQYQLELRAARNHLDPHEDVAAAFPVFVGRRVLGGLIFVTARRLFFIRAGLVTRKNRIREVAYAEIARVELEVAFGFDSVRLDLKDGGHLFIRSTFGSRGRMNALLELIEERMVVSHRVP